MMMIKLWNMLCVRLGLKENMSLSLIFNEFLSDLLPGLACASLWWSEFASFKGKLNFHLKLCLKGHLACLFVVPSVDLNAHASLDPFWRVIWHVIIYGIWKTKCILFFLLPLFVFIQLVEHPTGKLDSSLYSPKALGMAALGQEFGATVTKTSTLHLWDRTLVLNLRENWERAMT